MKLICVSLSVLSECPSIQTNVTLPKFKKIQSVSSNEKFTLCNQEKGKRKKPKTKPGVLFVPYQNIRIFSIILAQFLNGKSIVLFCWTISLLFTTDWHFSLFQANGKCWNWIELKTMKLSLLTFFYSLSHHRQNDSFSYQNLSYIYEWKCLAKPTTPTECLWRWELIVLQNVVNYRGFSTDRTRAPRLYSPHLGSPWLCFHCRG